MARVNDPRNEWLFTEAWGVDVAVSTPRMLAAMVEEAVSVGDLVRLLTLRQGKANLVEVTLPDNTPLAGRAVREVPLPREAALVAILRGGRVIVPQPDDPLEPGDEMMFVAAEDVEEEIQRVLKEPDRPRGLGARPGRPLVRLRRIAQTVTAAATAASGTPMARRTQPSQASA